MLLMEANPDRTHVNEIDPTRAEVLRQTFPHTTANDAMANAVPAVDVVLANPPFGKVKNERGEDLRFPTPDATTKELDHAIVFRALDAMKDDGRAVLIIGGKKTMTHNPEVERKAFYNSEENRSFFKSLYDRYNVVDHFTTSGDLYNRQGAAWPIDIITIEGRGKSALRLPGVDVPRIYNSFDELRGVLDAYGRMGAAGEHPGVYRGPRPAGARADEIPLPGTAGEEGTPAHPPGGGARGPTEHPSGDATGLPGGGGPTPEPVGGVPPGSRRTGEGEAGGAGAGVAPPGEVREPGGGEGVAGGRPGEQPGDVAAPGGPEGAGARPEGRPSLDDFKKLFDDAINETAPPEERRPPSEAPPPPTEPGPRAPRTGGEPRTEPTPPPVTTPEEDAQWRAAVQGIGKFFEEKRFRRELDPSIDPERYEGALPFLIDRLKALGAKDGDDMRPYVGQLIKILRDNFGFDSARLNNMTPYLAQLMSDVTGGHIRLEFEHAPLEPERAPEHPAETGPEPEATSQRRANTEEETRLQVHYAPVSEGLPVGTLVPVNMQTAITNALESLQTK